MEKKKTDPMAHRTGANIVKYKDKNYLNSKLNHYVSKYNQHSKPGSNTAKLENL